MSILSRAIDANRKTTSTGSKQTNKKEQEGRATTARPSLPTTSASSAIRSLTGGAAPKLPTAGPSRLEQAISASRRGETVRPQSWTDAESGFDSWLQEVNSFAQRMSQDYTKRSGKYQDAAAMSKYRSAADTTISQMENRSKSYRDFFSTRRDLYGDDTVDSILSALDEGDSYLEGLRKNLAGEADYWGQFEDEDAYKGYQRMSSYAKIPEAEDFAEKSRYVSTYKPGTEKFNAWSGTYTDTGYGDIAYDYINRDEKARSRQLVNDVGTNAALLGLDNSERGEMTDEEIGIFNYLYATQGPDTAYQYITDITSELNARQRAASEQEWAQYANEHPVGSSVFSILESPLKGLSYLGQAADYLSDGKIDQNEGYNKFSYMNSAIRNEVSKLAEDKWGGVGSFAYQTGMSMGDFLFNTAITGGQEALSLAIMGTGAAADSTISAKDRGLSDDQAFAIGTIAGAAEVITEKFSLDALLNTDWEQGAIKYILKNAFVEGSEEVGSDVINLVADVLVAKDKSEWQTSIEAYKAQGYSDSEAFGKAVGDQAMEMGVDFLGGALSGGIMAGGGAAVNMGGTYLTGREFNSMDLSAEDIQAFIDEGLASPPSSQAYQLAQAAQQKIAAGGTLSNYELGNLYQANVRAIDAEDDGSALLEQAARDAAEGKRLTNKAAKTILDNPSAVEILTRDAGLELTDDMTKAQRREAVKIAVNALARPTTATSATAANTATAEQGGAQTAQETRQETGPEVRQEVRQQQTAQPVQSVPLQAYNIRRLDQALSTLGPQGQAQARAFYDSEGQSAYEYYSGFSAYYEAGISGTDMGKVHSQYASALNENQKQAAYLAGQADAAASLAAERERIPTATVYGSEAGFIPTEYSAHLPREQVRTLNSLGRALGIKLQIVAPTGADGANGWNANGSIGIASDAENPFLVVAYHEVTHRMQELAPEEYRRYRDIAMRIKGAKDGTQGLVEGYKSRYAKAGQNLSTEQAMDEIAADFTGDLLREVDGFRDLARTDRSVAGKLLDAIRDFIRRVKRVFSGNRAAQNRSAMDYYGVDMNTLEEAARLWEDALRASEQAAYLATEEGQRAELSDRDTRYSLREKDPPKKVGVAYKVFVAKDGQLYPPMVANPGGAGTPVGVWLDADIGKAAPPSKTGRPQVQAGGKGTNAAKSSLAFRPGWHLGDIPLAKQFARLDPETGKKELFPANFVWAECEYAMDQDYQEEAMSYGYTESGKFRHSYAGLPRIPTDGYYRYRTNPNPDTVAWVITGAMRVTRILTDEETDAICREAGVEPMRRQGGPIDLEKYGIKAGDTTGQDTKFSLKGAVEETRDLLALHNLTEKNLLDALELGGMPMPSIAVVKAEAGHTKYGPISLVFNKGTIDPEADSRNKVYGGDAYTPTAPTVEYPVNSKRLTQIENELNMLARDKSVAGGIYGSSSILRALDIDDTSGRSREELAKTLAQQDEVRAAYLADQGRTLEPVKTDKVWDKYGNDTLQKVIDRIGAQGLSGIMDSLRNRASVEQALGEHADTLRDILREYYRESGEPLLRHAAARNQWTEDVIREKRETRVNNTMEKNVSIFTLENLARHAWEMYEDGGATKGEIDRTATSDALRAAVSDSAVEEWISGKLDGLLGAPGIYNGREPFTSSGNRRSFSALHYPYTLENIVRAMKANQPERGGQTWGISPGVLQATASSSYGSISELKRDSGRLGKVEGDDYAAKMEDVDRKIQDAIQRVRKGNKPHADNTFEEEEIIGRILLEAAKGKKTVDAIMRAFSKEGYTISSQTAQNIQRLYKDAAALPTEYFEAKPQRAVGFDEVLAAVIPDNASAALREGLQGAGVRMLEYKAGDEADRLRAVNSVEGARFSLKQDSQGRALTKAQQEYFKDSRAVDEEGRLLTLYHGTRKGGFTVFRNWTYLTANREYATNYADRDTGETLYEVYANIRNPFDTRIPACREIFEREFFGEYSRTPLQESGLPDWTDGYDLVDFLEEAGYDYDAILLDEGADPVDGRVVERGPSYVVRDPEQIKNVTNKNPTSDPDIRYSLKGTKDIEKQVAALQEENQLLRDRLTEYRNAKREAARQKERADYWQGQTRRTKAITTDKKSVQRAARELVNGYGAELDVADVAAELQSLYDYIAQGGDDFSATEAQERAEALAQKIVENAVAVEDEVYRQYSDLRSYLRTTKLSIAPEDSSDIADYGDFRKRYFGRLRLVKGRTNIDRVYAELSEMYPGFFNEQTHSAPSDQLLHIAEVLDSISEIQEYNPFSYDARNATVGIANEIMEKFFDLPQTKATFADRQARKLEAAVGKERQKLQQLREQRDTRLAQLREENRERVQRAVQTERERAGKKMDALKERYAARDAAGRERQSARELRAKITRHAKQLSQRLLQPNDKQHIPEGLRGPVAAMLEAINLESQYSIDPETGKRTKNGQGSPTKRTQAFLELKAQYAKIVQEGADMVIDPALLGDAASGFTGLFDEVIAMKDIRLADMSTAQLEKVWQTVRAVEHSVNKAGKILSASKFTRTQEWAASLQQDTETRRARKPLPTPKPLRNNSGGERKLATLDLETPYTYFSHYGDAGLAVYRMLRDAQDQQQVMVNQVAEEVGKIVTPKQVKDLNSKTHEFTTERGDKLTLTTAQVMEIYELTRRKQAHDHLMKGGIVQPQIGSANIQRGTDAILLTEGDLLEITKGLTAEQVKIADDLQKLTTGMLADMGNRASMAAYGYKKFTGTDYWPIKSAREGVHSNIETGGDNTRSIKNISLAKSVVPHASNPLDIAGIFDTFAAHAADMTDYAAWLCPMEDVNRLFNFRFLDADGNQTGRTVKGLLDRVGGPGAQAYWSRLMEDIQNGISASSDSTLTNIFTKGIGSFKGAAVGGNIRVIIQQPTAFFRAGAVLSPQDMARGLARGATRGNGWQKALQYSPIAQRKDAGGFDISSPLKMSEMLYDNRTRVRKLNDALSAPAGMADAITWGRLWNACEWAVAREHKDLPRGSALFYAEVNRLFTATIDQTQVVDGVLQRSQIMRSSNALAQQATAFMGEPIMSLNLAMRAYDQVRYEQDTKKRSRAIKALGRVATALVVTNAVNALAQSLIDAMRDDDEDKKYWERFRSAFTGLTGEEESAWDNATAIVMGGNLGSGMNPIGQIPFVKDIQSLIEGYDVSRTDMEVFSDLISAAQTVMTSAGGNGKKTRAYGVKELFAAGAKLFGIPASNLARDTWGLARSIAVETDNIPLQYEMEKAIYNITNSGNKARYLDIAYRALETGDLDLYRHITQELQEKTAEGGDGVTGPAITSGMRSRYDKRKAADPSYTLPRAALDLINSRETYSAPKEDTDAGFSDKDLNAAQYRAYEDQRAKLYREYADTLQGYGSFSGLEPATKDKLLKAADDLAKSIALEENSGGQYEETSAWKSWATGGAQYGVDEAEALLFKAAYDTIGGDKDEKTGKTIAGSKKENVLEAVDEMMPWLTDEELSYLMSAYWKQK